ncbi:hypothetical protein ACN4EG_21075 [Alkalinema pantanalense CENA528]|uniref:hypothetical protein n=1 Tax=Alkalinema pantanalense TaxID=1620705 RepID=UPI003D6EB70B
MPIEALIRSNDSPADITTRILETIKERAIEKWGSKRWSLELTRAYCELCKENGDDAASVNNRRRSINRVFESHGCNLETAIALAACVDCRFQLVRTHVEVLPI